MGRQWNTIIDALSGGTMAINVNVADIEALLATLQADIADGIIVTTGTVGANLRDGSGNLIESTSLAGKRRLDVNLSSVGTTGSAVSTTANLYGGTDGTNLRAISVDTTGRINVNSNTSTSGGTGPTTFTSTSYGTIADNNTSRRGLAIFNEGPGNLHVTLGTATVSTSSYTARLSSGDYYEVPFSYTGLIGGILGSAGTAKVTVLS